MECEFLKTNTGLIPADDWTHEWFAKLKVGRAVHGEFTLPRNPHFHRKFFALMKIGYDYFEETAKPLEFKGEEVKPDFDRFRKDITILAGRFHYVTNIKNEVRVEADSIRFGSMEETDFQKLYEKVLQILLERVLKGSQWNRERVEQTVEQIIGFAS